MKKELKTYEILDYKGKSHFVSAYSRKKVVSFWVSSNYRDIFLRKDIDPQTNLIISN